jgi:hypothetical protein
MSRVRSRKCTPCLLSLCYQLRRLLCSQQLNLKRELVRQSAFKVPPEGKQVTIKIPFEHCKPEYEPKVDQ